MTELPNPTNERDQRRAVPSNPTWHLGAMREVTETPTVELDGLAATTPRPAVTAPTRALPTLGKVPAISLPTLPKSVTRPQPLAPHQVKPDNKALQKHPTHPVTVVPAVLATVHPAHAVPLPPRAGAKARNHRLAFAGMLGALLVVLLIFVPIAHGAGFSVPSIGAQGGLAEYPTPTPTAVPIYPDHPFASGIGDFICVALPFARLVQQRELAAGLRYPWYVSMILAQWGVEHGWNIPDYTGYNWGNSSAIPGFPSVGGTGAVGSPGAFAYAYTPLQGVGIYVAFTQMGFYSGVTAAYPNGPWAQAIAMGQSPWDAGHYAEGGGGPGASLINVMRTFNLTRFDNPNAQC